MARQKRVYIVALTERYETTVLATSRQQAIDAVGEHGGSSPVWSKVTCSVAPDIQADLASIDATEDDEDRDS